MSWFTTDTSHLVVIGSIWSPLLLFFIYKIFRECGHKSSLDVYAPKGISRKEIDTNLDYPKYVLTAIFSDTEGFKLKGTDITLETVSKDPKAKGFIKTLSIVINCSKMEVSRDFCCLKYLSSSILSVRKFILPPISAVRVKHNGSKHTEIFFEGIETIDEMNGEIRFYSIKEYFFNSKQKTGKVFHIKPQTLSLFSKETFSPTFYCLSFETYGEDIDENINGAIVQPKLGWFEVFLFFSLVINSTFTAMTALLIEFNKYIDNKKVLIVVTVFVSGFLGFFITEMMAILYRRVIKRCYNFKCSPIKKSLGKSSLLWSLIRITSLSLIFVMSLVSVLLVYFLILKDIRLNKILKIDESIDETPVLIALLVMSLGTDFLLWFWIFGLFRFFIRLLCFRRHGEDIEKNNKFNILSDTTEASFYSTASDKKVERKESGQTLEHLKDHEEKVEDSAKKSKYSPKGTTPQFSNYDSKGYKTGGKRLTFNTERLDKDLADNQKRKKLMTNSVIKNATKSKGFENPEDFRLTHSQIDKQKNKNKKK